MEFLKKHNLMHEAMAFVSTALEKAKKDIKEYQEMKSLVLSRSDFDKVSNE